MSKFVICRPPGGLAFTVEDSDFWSESDIVIAKPALVRQVAYVDTQVPVRGLPYGMKGPAPPGGRSLADFPPPGVYGKQCTDPNCMCLLH